MRLIVDYVMNMLPYLLIALLILLVIRAVMHAVRKRQGFLPNRRHEFGVIVFLMFMTGLASQTIIPSWGLAASGFEININALYRINLIPFQSLRIIWRIFLNGGDPNEQIILLLGNIGMFAVPGFLLPVLWKRFERIKQTVLTCFFISLAIEITQLFVGRSTDIDDLLLNTFGGLLGFLLYVIIKKTLWPDGLEKFKSIKNMGGMNNDPSA